MVARILFFELFLFVSVYLIWEFWDLGVDK